MPYGNYMRLSEIYNEKYNRQFQNPKSAYFGEKKPIISFEVFPPKKDEDKLISELKELQGFSPELISITYGAGGSNKEGSLSLVKKIKELNIAEPMPHFTCMCSNKEFISQYLKEIEQLGIKNILALRGDEPKEIDVCYRDFRYANELVEFIKSKTKLSIAVAGYPECHADAKNLEEDIENLKRKVDAGADVIYTQLFFNNDSFYRYKQLVRDAGIYIPIIPGILPITSFSQLEKMTMMCNAVIPKSLSNQLEKYKDDIKATTEIGIDFAIYQCQNLIDAQVEGLHFFILNKSYSAKEILKIIL